MTDLPKFHNPVVCGAAGLALGAFGGIADDAQARSHVLSGQQISALFPGRISGIAYGYKNRDSVPFTVKVKANGRLKARSGFITDRGKWYVAGNRFCMQFRWLSRGKLKCRIVLKKGEWYHALRTNGTTKLKFRLDR